MDERIISTCRLMLIEKLERESASAHRELQELRNVLKDQTKILENKESLLNFEHDKAENLTEKIAAFATLINQSVFCGANHQDLNNTKKRRAQNSKNGVNPLDSCAKIIMEQVKQSEDEKAKLLATISSLEKSLLESQKSLLEQQCALQKTATNEVVYHNSTQTEDITYDSSGNSAFPSSNEITSSSEGTSIFKTTPTAATTRNNSKKIIEVADETSGLASASSNSGASATSTSSNMANNSGASSGGWWGKLTTGLSSLATVASDEQLSPAITTSPTSTNTLPPNHGSGANNHHHTDSSALLEDSPSNSKFGSKFAPAISSKTATSTRQKSTKAAPKKPKT